MSQKIEFLRTKTSGSDKIIFDNESNSYKNQHTTIVKGYDHILGSWNLISKTSVLQDVSKHPNKPEKTKSFYVVIQRKAIDYATLKPLSKWFKQKITVSMKNLDCDTFLVMVHGKLFMTNVLGIGVSRCAPICLTTIMTPSFRPEIIEVNISKEVEPISDLERDQLLKQGFPMYEEVATPDGSVAEFRMLT